jgi:hypothetical protein
MKTKFSLLISVSLLFVLSSCKKDASPLDQTSINLADDEVVSEAIFEDLFNTIDDATIGLDEVLKNGDTKSSVLSIEDPCPAITVEHPSSDVWPKVITIDYGTGCTGFFNQTRSGKIIIEVTGHRREEGSKRTVTFDNYYFNGIKVEGEKIFENLGLNENQNFVVSVTLTDGKLILPDGKTIERSVDHKREWIAGFLTPNIWDDECLITGTATGMNGDGISYVQTITSPLHWKRVCEFIVSGTIEIDRSDADPFVLDYGDGECDNKAVVSMGGESKEIELRHRHRNWKH